MDRTIYIYVPCAPYFALHGFSSIWRFSHTWKANYDEDSERLKQLLRYRMHTVHACIAAAYCISGAVSSKLGMVLS